MAEQEVALLEAKLRADPTDDESWLVYGDWLQDQGDVRGVILGLEHRLAHGDLTAPERMSLEREIRTLRSVHEADSLAGIELSTAIHLVWRYGFIIGMRLPGDRPSLAVLRTIIARPVGRFLADVSLSGLDFADLQALLAIDGLSLRRLVLEGAWSRPTHGIGNNGLSRVLRCKALRSLAELRVPGNAIGARGMNALQADTLPELKVLDLKSNTIGDNGIEALTQSHRPTLTSLWLNDNTISDRGAAALARSEAWPALQTLGLAGNEIGLAGARELARSPLIQRLSALDLRSNRLSPESVGVLIEGLVSIASLDLRDNSLDEATLHALRHRSMRAGRAVSR